MEILHIENLSFKYPKSQNNAVDNVSINVDSGDFVVICGESGCGKTTLLKLLKKELSPAGEKSGQIIYCGTEQESLDERTSSSEIGYVLQNPDALQALVSSPQAAEFLKKLAEGKIQ